MLNVAHFWAPHPLEVGQLSGMLNVLDTFTRNMLKGVRAAAYCTVQLN